MNDPGRKARQERSGAQYPGRLARSFVTVLRRRIGDWRCWGTTLVLGLVASLLAGCGPAVAPKAVRVVRPTPVRAVAPAVPPPASPPTPAPVAPTELQVALAGALSPYPGCVAVYDRAGLVASVNPGLVLAPASTQKHLVAAAALSVLGPDYRFVTKLVAAGPVTSGLAPRLWLVGSGDPMLAVGEYGAALAADPRFRGAPVTPLEWLADQAVAAGVKVIPGGVAGDDTRYSPVRYLPTWPAADVTEGDVGPLSALSLDEGFQQWARRLIPAADPAADAAEKFSELLAARGVGIGPVAPDGAAPAAGVVVASVTSAPLSQIVAFMLESSDNHVAELLTREVGLRLTGDGSTAAGVRAVLAAAARLGVPTRGGVMVDGSGLSPENRATCAELLAALDLGGRPGLSAITSGLAVAGRSGTLVDRWRRTDLAGRLTAKTGWITGAAAMVGRLPGPEPLRFALIVNGVNRYGDAQRVEDAVVAALDAYRP